MTKKNKVAASKDPKWWENRNARRRERYATDPDYRAAAVEASRRSYGRNRRMTWNSCTVNLSRLADFGTVRSYLGVSDELNEGEVTFTTQELANALRRGVQVLYRWMGNGMFPDPVAKLVEVENQHGYVYTLKEAHELVRIMGEHQQQTPYYRKAHTELRRRLFAAVGGGDV